MKLESEGHTAHRFGRQVYACPTSSPANQSLRLRPLSEADFKHPLVPYVEIIKAARNVVFQSVACRVVRAEEGRTVATELLVETAQQVITAGVRLPEVRNVSFRNDFGHVVTISLAPGPGRV